MVPSSQVRGGRSSAAILEVESRPEMETRQEVEIEPETENRAEIEITDPVSMKDGLDTTRPETVVKQADSVSSVAPRDKPETALTLPLPARHEIPSETSKHTQTYFSH